MTVTSSQALSLLENVLFETPALAQQNVAAWVTVGAPGGVTNLASAMLDSAEAGIPEEIVRLYEGVLGRDPGEQEIAYYTNLIDQQVTPAQIAAGPSGIPQHVWDTIASYFVSAPEFTSAGSDVVQTLYKNVLSRTPSADEASYYATQIAHGATAVQLVQDFINSPEYIAKVGPSTGTLLGDYGIAVANNPSSPPASLAAGQALANNGGETGVVWSSTATSLHIVTGGTATTNVLILTGSVTSLTLTGGIATGVPSIASLMMNIAGPHLTSTGAEHDHVGLTGVVESPAAHNFTL